MNDLPLVYTIVLTWNDADEARACLTSLASQTYPNLQVLVIDNGSHDGMPQAIAAEFPGTRLLRLDRNRGYAEGNNIGIHHALEAGADYVLLLNDDTVVDPDAISLLVATAEREPTLGMVGPALVSYQAPNYIYLGGRIDWRDGRCHEVAATTADLAEPLRLVDYVPGCALLVRTAVVRRIGLLDTSYFAYYEDVDWNLRCQRVGYQSAVVPAAQIRHKNTADARSRDSDRSLYYPRRNQILFLRTHARGRYWQSLYRILAVLLREYRTLVSRGDTKKARSVVAGMWAGLLRVKGEDEDKAPRLVVALFAQLAALQEQHARRREKDSMLGRVGQAVKPYVKRLVRPREYRLDQGLPDLLPAARNVMIAGYISSSSGLGEAARGSIAALQHIQHPVSYCNLDPTPTLAKGDMPANCLLEPGRRVNLLHVNAVNVKDSYRQLTQRFFAGHINVAYWFWEMTTFPRRWYGAFEPFDEIWVASRYTQAVLAAISPIPVVHMRPLVQPATPADVPRAALGLPANRFIFLFAFDALSIIERKNPWGLVEAFHRAFSAPTSGPLLVLKMNNSDLVAGRDAWLGLAPAYARRLEQAVQAVNGILLDTRFDRATVSALMAACDCYVSLHRCEGFGLTIAEAMYFGKPCLATAYSGNLDFMTPSNSYPVGYRLVELERDWGPYEAGDHWAEPDLDHAAALMRQVYEQQEAAAARGRLAAQDIRHWYGAEAVSRAMYHRLQLLTMRRSQHRALKEG